MPTQLLLHEDIGEAHSYHHCMVRYERHLILDFPATLSVCLHWTLKCCNLIGLQNSCSGTNPGIVMSPTSRFSAWRFGSARLGWGKQARCSLAFSIGSQMCALSRTFFGQELQPPVLWTLHSVLENVLIS